MRIQVDQPTLIDDLVRFLQRCECAPTEARKNGVVSIEANGTAPNPALARLQLDGYLKVWCAMHPGVRAEFDG